MSRAALARALALSILASAALRPLAPFAQERPAAPLGHGRSDEAREPWNASPPAKPPGFEGVWHEAEHTPRQYASVVYDTRRQRLIEFGGRYVDYHNAVWTYSPRGEQRWEPMIVVGVPPAPRYGAAAVYDSLNDRVVLFGGLTRASRYAEYHMLGDLWELRLGGLPRWHRLEAEGSSPAPREYSGVALDTRRRRMIVIAGATQDQPQFEWPHSYRFDNQVWAFSLDGPPRWEQITPSGAAPTAAMNYAAAYDPDHDAIVMMGGAGTNIEFMPPQTLRRVWSLSLGRSPAWSDLGPDGFPAGPGGFPDLSFSLANDPIRHRFAAFSGYDTLAKILALEPTPAWSDLAAAGTAPHRREGVRMVRDPVADELLVVGDYPDGAWHLPLAGGNTWRLTNLVEEAPPPTGYATLSPDPERRRMLLCGGIHRVPDPYYRLIWAPTDEVWSFSLDDERWMRLDNVRVPHGGLTGHNAIRDERHDRLLLIGGSRPGDSLGTTVPNPLLLELSLGAMRWSEHDVGANPGAAPSSGIALDEFHDRLLVPGTTTDLFYSGQVWALPLDGEVRWTPFGGPGQAMTSTLYGQSAILDPLRRRMIVEGGAFENPSLDRGPLWALDLSGEPSWAPLAAVGRPPIKRIWQFSAYDRVEDRMLTFGGTLFDYPGTPHTPTTDLWSLALGGVPTWDSLHVYGPIPIPTVPGVTNYTPANPATGFDPESRKLVVTRGGGGGETSVLDFTPPTRLVECLASGAGGHGRGFERGGGAIAVAILSEPDFDARRLDPRLLRLDGAPVERAGRGWKTRVLDADGDGRLDLECTFARRGGWGWRDAAAPEDRAPAVACARPGSAMLTLTGIDPEGYPLRGDVVVSAERRAALEADAAQAAAAPAFALAGVTPNPSADGRLSVRFSLADPGPARLEMIDLAGRVMISREVGGATGERFVSLTPSEAPWPGVYWLCLRQAEGLAIRKVVVLR